MRVATVLNGIEWKRDISILIPATLLPFAPSMSPRDEKSWSKRYWDTVRPSLLGEAPWDFHFMNLAYMYLALIAQKLCIFPVSYIISKYGIFDTLSLPNFTIGLFRETWGPSRGGQELEPSDLSVLGEAAQTPLWAAAGRPGTGRWARARESGRQVNYNDGQEDSARAGMNLVRGHLPYFTRRY